MRVKKKTCRRKENQTRRRTTRTTRRGGAALHSMSSLGESSNSMSRLGESSNYIINNDSRVSYHKPFHDQSIRIPPGNRPLIDETPENFKRRLNSSRLAPMRRIYEDKYHTRGLIEIAKERNKKKLNAATAAYKASIVAREKEQHFKDVEKKARKQQKNIENEVMFYKTILQNDRNKKEILLKELDGIEKTIQNADNKVKLLNENAKTTHISIEDAIINVEKYRKIAINKEKRSQKLTNEAWGIGESTYQ